jgi:hypothetical protein
MREEINSDGLIEAAEELSRIIEAAPEWKPEELDKQKQAGFQAPAHWIMADFATIRELECSPLYPIIKDLGIFKGSLIFMAAQSQTGKTLLILYLIRSDDFPAGTASAALCSQHCEEASFIWNLRIQPGAFKADGWIITNRMRSRAGQFPI